MNLKWVLGEEGENGHCPSCAALNGQVHTKADWDAAGLKPACGALYCQDDCRCSLVKTDDAVSGALGDAPQREPEVLDNIGWTRLRSAAGGDSGGRADPASSRGNYAEASEALAWIKKALSDDPQKRRDDARLEQILKLEPEVLCKRQAKN